MKTGVAPIKSPGRYSVGGQPGLFSTTNQEQKSIFVGGMSKALMQGSNTMLMDDDVTLNQQSSENMSGLLLAAPSQKSFTIEGSSIVKP